MLNLAIIVEQRGDLGDGQSLIRKWTDEDSTSDIRWVGATLSNISSGHTGRELFLVGFEGL